jgi:hypothetical protein
MNEVSMTGEDRDATVFALKQVIPYSAERMARKAYAAYGQTTDYKNFQGNPMPTWDALPEAIRTAWKAAAEEVSVSIADELINGTR